MKLIILLLSAVTLASCGKPANKTIKETISEKTNVIEEQVKITPSTDMKAAIMGKQETTETVVIKEPIDKPDVNVQTPELTEAVSKTNISNKSKEVAKAVTSEIKTNSSVDMLAAKAKEAKSDIVETSAESKPALVEKVVASTPVTTKEKELEKVVAIQKPQVISHKAWDALLKKHVDNKGNVSYSKFKNDEAALDAYLAFLSNNKPTQKNSKNEKLAYYINLYNAATVKLILDNYPVNSIKDIKSPWGKEWVKVGNETLSLGHIEHKILRKMNEPRIHFAINCASYSCPKLVNTIFTANNMERQLEKATKDFINDTTRNQFSKKANLSKIFKWYKNDFTDNGSLLEYIAKYTTTALDTNSKIVHLDYNWNLNETK